MGGRLLLLAAGVAAAVLALVTVQSNQGLSPVDPGGWGMAVLLVPGLAAVVAGAATATAGSLGRSGTLLALVGIAGAWDAPGSPSALVFTALEPVQPGKNEVEQDDVRREIGRQSDRRLPVGRLSHHVIAVVLQHRPDPPPEAGVVVDDQQGGSSTWRGVACSTREFVLMVPVALWVDKRGDRIIPAVPRGWGRTRK